MWSKEAGTPLVARSPAVNAAPSFFSQSKSESTPVQSRQSMFLTSTPLKIKSPDALVVDSVSVPSYEDDDIPLPSNSITNVVSIKTDYEATDALRRRHRGLDLGEPRGFDLQAMTKQDDQADVTAAVHMISVKTPWVTVFGFPSGYGAGVLAHMQSFGEVLQHVSENGNWMHLLYANKVQASRATAQNGKMVSLGENKVLMLGVKPCSNPAIGKNQQSFSSVQFQTTGLSHHVVQPQELKKAPSRSASMCKRFWTWVLDL